MGTYFDAVLNVEYEAVFNGTTEETVKYIKSTPKVRTDSDYRVCIGRTMEITSVDLYMDRFDK